jgi:drug/metabolite transporter (DMT)-like permease
MHRKSVVAGCVTMLLSTAFFASMHACVRYLSADIHPFEIAFFRNLFGVVFLLPFIVRNGGALLRTQHLNWHMVRALINVFAMLIFFYALSITPLATVQALSFTAPLFTTVLAVLLLGEKVRFRRWAAVITGFCGVMVILRPGAQPIELGALLVLLSASIWALTMIIIKRLSNTDSPLTITAYVTVFLTVLSFIPALWFWTWPVGTQWLWLALAAGAGTLGQLCVAKAFAYADTTVVLPFDFAKIFWGALLGFLFFGEYVSAYTWLGAVIIFGGATYVAYRERQIEKLKRS